MASNQRRKQSASAVGPEQLIRLEGSSSSKRSNDGKPFIIKLWLVSVLEIDI